MRIALRAQLIQPISRRKALAFQILVLVLALAAWEVVPAIPGLTKAMPSLDPFIISSPTRTYRALVSLFAGTTISGSVWPYLAETLRSALFGTFNGLVLGTVVGILLSNDERLDQVLRPSLLAFNAVPRIALIPIFVILLGPTSATAIVSATITSFFTVFFNAYAGGRSVPPHVVENAWVLGASELQVMRRIRLPYVLAWSFAAVPNALSHGLLAAATAEILTGYAGLGRLLIFAIGTASAPLTFAVVVVLSVLGVVLVIASDLLRTRWLHWWTEGRAI